MQRRRRMLDSPAADERFGARVAGGRMRRSEYDHGVNTFSPEGRLFQVEYAIEAIKLGSTAVGVLTKEGVVLAVEKRITSPLLEPARCDAAACRHTAEWRILTVSQFPCAIAQRGEDFGGGSAHWRGDERPDCGREVAGGPCARGGAEPHVHVR